VQSQQGSQQKGIYRPGQVTPAAVNAATKAQSDAAEASKHFDKQLAWKHLINQVNYGPRVPGTPAHDKCEQYILDETKKYCDDVREQRFTYTWSKTRQVLPMQNIIGTQNWKNASVRVILTAHWDSRAEADHDPVAANQNKPIPAANDGASGVAVMLELMRVMRQQNPTVGIMYFFNDGEDLGPSEDEMYLGSRLVGKY
jgi:glutaminyl-peptide cyclotransferase